MAEKEFVTSSNIKKYFDYRSVSLSQLKPGMLVSFRYHSPDRQIHDVNPLIYVAEKKSDRVFGYNIHYKFGILALAIADKRKELEAKVKGYKDTTNTPEQPKTNRFLQPKTSTPVVNAQSSLKPSPYELRMQKVKQRQLAQQQKSGLAPKPGSIQPTAKPAPIIKPVVPMQLLETYQLQIEPVTILRNYLFPRMSGLQKLIFKP